MTRKSTTPWVAGQRPGGVDAQVQQRHLPHVAGERVQRRCAGPRPGPGAGAGRGTAPGSRRCRPCRRTRRPPAGRPRAASRRRRGGRAGSAPRWDPAAAVPGHGVAARRAARRAAVRAARPGENWCTPSRGRSPATQARPARRTAEQVAVGRCSRLPWNRHSPRRAMLSRSQPATWQAGARASGRARAMNAAIGSVRSLPQQRSCRKHSPQQCRSPSQPGTEHGPRLQRRVARGGGAASKSGPARGPRRLRARRQPSQRPRRAAGRRRASRGAARPCRGPRRCPGRR